MAPITPSPVFATSGKPSTRLPLGELVEQGYQVEGGGGRREEEEREEEEEEEKEEEGARAQQRCQ